MNIPFKVKADAELKAEDRRKIQSEAHSVAMGLTARDREKFQAAIAKNQHIMDKTPEKASLDIEYIRLWAIGAHEFAKSIHGKASK